MKESTYTQSFHALLIVALACFFAITWLLQAQVNTLQTQVDLHRAWDDDLAKRHHKLWMSFEDFKKREDFCKCEK
jgi:1,4-dihydroxy-2-naphthoate octaprenyltransferase